MTGPFTLLTWNVNSVRARLDNVLTYLDERQPEVACLQETRVEDRAFPRVPFLELGYFVSTHGSKGYAGVATLSKQEPDEVQCGFREPPEDRHCRLLTVRFGGLSIVNVYAPNGTALDSENFAYKLQWFARLRDELTTRAPTADTLVCGDFNVIPEARDVWDAEAFAGQLHFTREEREALAGATGPDLRDCFRKLESAGGHFSFFDYQRRAWERGHGMRIDHVYASPAMYARCVAVEHDLAAREAAGASDHVPVLARFG